jgi:hypothetical protein
MSKIKKLAGIFVPFTITETIDFEAAVFTFTTTGGVLCPFGTFVDELHAVGGSEKQPKVSVLSTPARMAVALSSPRSMSSWSSTRRPDIDEEKFRDVVCEF